MESSAAGRSAYPHLMSPVRVGHLVLPNRVMMGSMHTGLEHRQGGFERLAAFYSVRAANGVALMATGGFSPNTEGNLGPHRTELSTQEDARAHSVIPAAVHAAGGRIVLQILHSGRYGYHDAIVAPSAIRAPINSTVPRQMDEADIARTIEDFARCAALAREAGYDGVEVMGSEGYLITEFLTPRTNHRTDAWGGSLENRQRFPLSVVRAIRERVGADFLTLFRISALDLVEGGSTRTEILSLARAVEAAGADMLTSGIGWHEARVPTIAQAVPRGGFVWAESAIKQAVSIPLAASNRINTPEIADAVIAAGDADVAMMARALLADEAFAKKAARGDRAGINICIACNQACLDHYFEGRVSTCLVNPRACFETEIVPRPAVRKRRVAVVGGGPGGLAAAAVAAERGHETVLFEAEKEIGGQFRLAQRIPGKSEFAESVAYFETRLVRAGVEIRKGRAATAEDLLAEGFDAVVLATGVRPRVPDIPGIERPSVVGYDDLIAGRRQAGRRVAIVGAGGIGFDVALLLAEGKSRTTEDPAAFAAAWGIDMRNATPGGLAEDAPEEPHRSQHEIVMLKRSAGRFGTSLGKSTGWIHRAALARAGVTFLAGVHYEAIGEDGLQVRVDGKRRVVPADTVVLCAGQESNRDLLEPLRGAGLAVHAVGGASEARELDAKRAIREATEVAIGL